MTTTPHRERNRPVSTAPHVVTREEADKARKAHDELERTEKLLTGILVILGIGGLLVTAVNVTEFAIEHHVSPYIAWMLDPLVSLSLLAALFIDGKLAAHGYRPGGWPFVLRWFAGLSTWLMNCWGSLYPDGQFTGWPDRPDPAGLLLHSVIPFLVIVLAEAGAGYRRFSTRRKPEHLATVKAWQDQEDARRQAARDEEKRAEDARRAEAEAERKRAAELAAEEKRAAIDAAKARELAEAEERKIRAQSEAEARLAEQARLDAEARFEREAKAREEQARVDRETAEHAAVLERQRIQAEAEAAALKARAESEARSAEEKREERRKAAEARRGATAIPSPEPTAIPASGATAKPRKLTALPGAVNGETDDVRGAEAKRKQIEEATFEAAVLLSIDQAPTRKDFAARYGRGETWGRDRYADAERLMADDADFAARIRAEAETRLPAEQVSA